MKICFWTLYFDGHIHFKKICLEIPIFYVPKSPIPIPDLPLEWPEWLHGDIFNQEALRNLSILASIASLSESLVDHKAKSMFNEVLTKSIEHLDLPNGASIELNGNIIREHKIPNLKDIEHKICNL